MLWLVRAVRPRVCWPNAAAWRCDGFGTGGDDVRAARGTRVGRSIPRFGSSLQIDVVGSRWLSGLVAVVPESPCKLAGRPPGRGAHRWRVLERRFFEIGIIKAPANAPAERASVGSAQRGLVGPPNRRARGRATGPDRPEWALPKPRATWLLRRQTHQLSHWRWSEPAAVDLYDQARDGAGVQKQRQAVAVSKSWSKSPSARTLPRWLKPAVRKHVEIIEHHGVPGGASVGDGLHRAG